MTNTRFSIRPPFFLQHKEGNVVDLSDGFTVTSLGNNLPPQSDQSQQSSDITPSLGMGSGDQLQWHTMTKYTSVQWINNKPAMLKYLTCVCMYVHSSWVTFIYLFSCFIEIIFVYKKNWTINHQLLTDFTISPKRKNNMTPYGMCIMIVHSNGMYIILLKLCKESSICPVINSTMTLTIIS